MVGEAAAGAGAVWRSSLFNVLFYAWTAVYAAATLPLLLGPRRAGLAGARIWARSVLWLLARTVGLRYRIRGRENLPRVPAVIAVKHQSAWETLVFPVLLPDPVYVLKRELLAIPLFGWYLRRLGMIGIDRGAGSAALRRMVRAARGALEHGRQVVIFPEGTRVPVGQSRPYHTGVAALYGMLDVPVVPAALNSGLFWRRRGFLKQPGVITLEFLPAIAPGLNRAAFTRELEARIEDATRRLVAEAEQEAQAARRLRA